MPNDGRDKAGRLHAEFPVLLARHDRQLLRYISTFLHRRGDAEEVLQRTAIALWETMDKYDHERDFLPWATRVAYFEVLNFRKQAARDRLIFSEAAIAALAQTRDAMESELEARRIALRRCLSKLSQDDVGLLGRRYGDAATLADFARELGQSAKSVYRRLDRLREGLARCVNLQITSDGIAKGS